MSLSTQEPVAVDTPCACCAPKGAAAAPSPEERTPRAHLWVLLVITVLGGVLRFMYPQRPPLWGDDAYTIYRTHAEYQPMLDILQDDGFTPLHYQLHWLWARLGLLTPTMVRMLPAFFGSLMAPAMYLLAAHLVRRRSALMIALISACSAYLLGYSRDGKMYMMAWSMVALSTGCFLWWLKRPTLIAWLSWVASALAMVSSHLTGVVVILVQVLIFFTPVRLFEWLGEVIARRGAVFEWMGRSPWDRWGRHPLAQVGQFPHSLTLIPVPTAARSVRENLLHWGRRALLFTGGRLLPLLLGLVIVLSGPLLYRAKFSRWIQQDVEDAPFEVEGLSWVVPYNAGRTGPDLVKYSTAAYLQSWEWPKETDQHKVAPWVLSTLKCSAVLLLIFAGVGLMPWSAKLRGITDRPIDQSPQSWWRLALWLGLWITIPVYFVYCRSTIGFASPDAWWKTIETSLAGPQWLTPGGDINGWFWVIVAGMAAAFGAAVFAFRRFREAMVWLIPGAAIVSLLVFFLRMGWPAKEPQGEQWVGFLLGPAMAWWDWAAQSTVCVSLLVALPGLILYYCGATWGERLIQAIRLAAVSAIILWACWSVYHWAGRQYGETYAQQFKRMADADRAFKVLAERSPAMARQRVESALAAPGGNWQTIFMPRYFGFVFIAFTVALGALYMRLPTRPVRVVAIGLLVAVNLAVFGARLFAGTEPPLDRVAQDLWRHDRVYNAAADKTGLVFVDDQNCRDATLGGAGHPANGTLSGQQGKYYLGLARGHFLHPYEWKRSGSLEQNFSINTGDRRRMPEVRTIVSQASDPKIMRVITWEKFYDVSAPRYDALVNQLGKEWVKIADEQFIIRFHWDWRELYVYVRREYVRRPVGPASTKPNLLWMGTSK